MPNEAFEIWKDIQELQEEAIGSRFDRWKDAIELQIKWQKHLLDLRGESIKQWTALAKGQREWAKVYLQRWSIKKMTDDFKQLQRQLHQTRSMQRKLTRAADHCKICRNPGRRQATSLARMWSGFTVLSSVVPFEVVKRIYERRPTPEELDGSHYRYYGPSRDQPLLPTTPTNALEWCEQLRTLYYVPQNGSPAHMLLMEVFSHLADYAEQTVQEIAAKLKLLEQGAYDLWKPQAFLKF